MSLPFPAHVFVVHHREVHEAVAIEVPVGRPAEVAALVDARRGSHLHEPVMPERVRPLVFPELVRLVIDLELTVEEVPVGDVDVQIAVVVIIQERRSPAVVVPLRRRAGRSERTAGEPHLLGDVHEGPPAILQERILPEIGHEYIQPSVLVVVPEGDPHRPSRVRRSRGIGNVGERAVPLVAIELVVAGVQAAVRVGTVVVVGNVEIDVAVVVIVGDGQPSPHVLPTGDRATPSVPATSWKCGRPEPSIPVFRNSWSDIPWIWNVAYFTTKMSRRPSTS